LTALGVEFDTVVPKVTETRDGEPAMMVLENARRKALAGCDAAPDGTVVLGVDTDVFLDGAPLGKPADREGARQRLEALSGRTHEVLSGLVLLGPTSEGGVKTERSGFATTRVSFHELSEETLTAYLDSGEWQGRAGAYAIQARGSIFAERIEGDLSNVIGLPVTVLVELAPELLASRS
jgi:septum formation protein